MTASHRPGRLVFDTTCLSHFARVDRLDVLGDLLVDFDCFVPQLVREELRTGSSRFPQLERALDVEWLQIVNLDTIERLQRFALWSSRVGAETRDIGEASVLAMAEELGAIALIDDRDATRVGRSYGIEVHGTLWLLAIACREGQLTEAAAANLVDTLASSGMRLPCKGVDFSDFARAHGLL